VTTIAIMVVIGAVIIALIWWRRRASAALDQANNAAREARIAEFLRVNYVGIQQFDRTPEQARAAAIRVLTESGVIH